MMKEYGIEDGTKVDLNRLISAPMPKEAYVKAHQYLPIACHDIIIEYNEGILLVERDNFPLKNSLCVIGGRVSRGMSTLKSLQKKVKEECNLELEDIQEVGTS